MALGSIGEALIVRRLRRTSPAESLSISLSLNIGMGIGAAARRTPGGDEGWGVVLESPLSSIHGYRSGGGADSNL
eukprot:scaffold148213_cov28-Tisochrysis_lutea.AAC.2